MKNHVPDLERCKRLKEAGFPQEGTHFWWDYSSYGSTVRVMCNRSTHNGFICAAPIVTELVEEIESLTQDHQNDDHAFILKYQMDFDDDVMKWYASNTIQFVLEEDPESIKADTLPNALADLWLALKGENHDT